MDFKYRAALEANPLGSCPMDFKYRAALEANPLRSCLMDWKELRTCKAKLNPLGSSYHFHVPLSTTHTKSRSQCRRQTLRGSTHTYSQTSSGRHGQSMLQD
jgi:hypothetical protein